MRRKLLSILDSISFCQTYPEAIQLEFFEPSAIDRLILTCEQRGQAGSFCNVKVLHKALMTELNNMQGATAGIGQRQVIVGVAMQSQVFYEHSVEYSLLWQSSLSQMPVI